MRVLVMEDNWLIADAIADVLLQAGVSVVGPIVPERLPERRDHPRGIPLR
jgi:hypothetical protein